MFPIETSEIVAYPMWNCSISYMAWFGFMVFNATFNNISPISWRSVLLVEETGGPGENHRPVASQTNFII